MSFTEFALRMWPSWALGAFMIAATVKAGYKELVRVEKKPVLTFLKFMLKISAIRALIYAALVLFKVPMGYVDSAKEAVSILPWAGTLTVFWEDACHGLPLVLLAQFLGDRWYARSLNFAALLLVMFSFGLGHTYQGVIAAIMLSFYIPFSMDAGKKYGFGTVMVCHTLYDLITILMVKFLSGF